MRAEDVAPALVREMLQAMRAGGGEGVERHHVAGVRVFPRDSAESGEALGADVLGKKGKIGWVDGEGIVMKEILNRWVDCVGANSATHAVASGDFGAAGV